MLLDVTVDCSICEKPFTWSATAQLAWRQHCRTRLGYESPALEGKAPTRCPSCRIGSRDRQAQKEKQVEPEIEPQQCAECGQWWIPTSLRAAKYCSTECAAEVNRRASRARAKSRTINRAFVDA